MSENGKFVHDGEDDIVILQAISPDVEVTGWINVGMHAVKITLHSTGDILIESFARTNETEVLGQLETTRDEAVRLGGYDPEELESIPTSAGIVLIATDAHFSIEYEAKALLQSDGIVKVIEPFKGEDGTVISNDEGVCLSIEGYFYRNEDGVEVAVPTENVQFT